VEEYRVGIVIPAFNEELMIAQVVNSVKGYGYAIVVNDASTDRTRKIAEDAGAIVINHKDNKGYDGALNSGFKRAEELDCDGVITFDADGQHSVNILSQYINHLEKGMDLVLGIRPKTQRFSEWVFKIYTKFFINWSDPLCGMKGYSMKLYKNKGCFDSYNSIGTELAAYGIYNGYKYVEINIPTMAREDSPRFGSRIRSNIVILKALINLTLIKKL
jgi:glycosyltransferase involved in cell wall biosynthesis